MGIMLAEPGFHTRCYVEWEAYPRSVIIAAQRAGYLEPAPIWDDLTTFDAKPLAGAIDTLLAGYPCQPFSQAGQRRGADDERHLWPDVARIARELGPALQWIILENVAGHVTLGAETVLRELWDMGFTPAAGLFSASEVGATHERIRWFCVAYRRHPERRPEDAAGYNRHGTDTGWAQGDGRSGKRRQDVDHTPSPRRDGAGIGAGADSQGGQRLSGAGCGDVGNAAGIGRRKGRPEPEFRSGRNALASAGGELADSHDTGPQGQQPEQRDTQGRQEQAGHAGLRSGAGLFPPGPGNHDAWADTLAVAPDLAPAASLGDAFTQACDLAAADQGPEQAQAESAVCRMADGLASRSRALRLLGNGVVPLVAAHAIRTLGAAHGLRPVDLDAAEGRAGTSADADGFVRMTRTP